MASPFSSAEVMRHRDGVRAPKVYFETENKVLVMMGRRIPVISAELLDKRLRMIGCREDVIEEIVGNLFGYPLRDEILFCERVAAEAPVTPAELSESLI